MVTLDLQNLLVCRNILKDKLIQELDAAVSSPEDLALAHRFAGHLLEKAEEEGWSGNLIRDLFLNLLSQEGCLAAKMAEASQGQIGASLHQAFIHDMKKLLPALTDRASEIVNVNLLDDYMPSLPHKLEATAYLEKKLEGKNTPEEITQVFVNYYTKYGYGEIASYPAFCWNSKRQKLQGIRHFEAMDFADLIGYDFQKEQLINNTLAFINHRPANNVLLVGARGTGKSSGVKALANAYYSDGLRLIQMQKSQLSDLPGIMANLRQFASKRFIIFFDDLSFEESDSDYKYLKSAIEGGVESKPENVLIYATSNRRHLIKETWHDRNSEQDEMFRNDSINETISLSDRFGLIINYIEPNQQEYLAIIDHFLRQEGIEMEPEELRIEGNRWYMNHSGRSGRTARQFVTHYIGQMKHKDK